ncbi:MAG: methylated-DNA--[protein]-cysteine S-methyltransferase [bacterium]|nr:methylated-DNA--[protein]-cysteine S-methyltransferase [bacterium]
MPVWQTHSQDLILRILVSSSLQGLREVLLSPWPSAEFSESARYRIKILFSGEFPPEGLRDDLRAYFCGQAVDFSTYPVYWQAVSSFVQKTLKAAQTIPWGETRTYGWLSSQLEPPSSPRAVGQALGQNPWPIIFPCHRIIGRGGYIGGFSSGLAWKKFLLSLEKGKISLSGRVEFLNF